MTMTSAAQVVVVLAQQVGQRVRPDLLLTLDEHRDAHAEVVAERPDRAEVGHDAGLVVGRSAGEEPAVALGGLERRGVPLRVVVLGLDVVVGIEEHRRPALRGWLAREHRRRSAVLAGTHHLDVLEPVGTEQLGDGVGAALHLGGAGGVGADRLDPDEVLEVLADAGQLRGHPGTQLSDVHGARP